MHGGQSDQKVKRNQQGVPSLIRPVILIDKGGKGKKYISSKCKTTLLQTIQDNTIHHIFVVSLV